MSFKEAVDRGIKFLDYFHPGWKEKIDVDKLDMDDNECCILGQLYGDYCENPLEFNQCYNYGFTGSRTDMPELTKEWRSRFLKNFDLSKEEVHPGKYKITKRLGLCMVSELAVGKTVEVLKFYGDYRAEGVKVKNMVRVDNELYSDPQILVHAVDSE